MNSYFNTLTTLLLAHMIADFPLQAGFIYRWKIKSLYGLVVHALLHSVATALLFQKFFTLFPILLLIGICHFMVDWVKINTPTQRLTVSFLLDQAIHGSILALLAFGIPDSQPVIAPWLISITLVCMLLPFLLMFFWMVSSDMVQKGHPFPFAWDRNNLIHWSKQSGWVILIAMILVEAGVLLL